MAYTLDQLLCAVLEAGGVLRCQLLQVSLLGGLLQHLRAVHVAARISDII
jgi:hypothetical protein